MFTNTPTIQAFRVSGTMGTLGCIFTKLSRKTFATYALKVTFFCALYAGAAVEARRRLAFVDDLIAVITAEARSTFARVRAVIVEAHTVVLAWIACALVDVLMAQISGVAGAAAIARKSANLIHANSTILTRLRFAIVEVCLASAAEEAIQALALICFTVGWNSTRSVIKARILLAQWMRLDGRLAEFSREVTGAETLEVPDSIFVTGAAVPTSVFITR